MQDEKIERGSENLEKRVVYIVKADVGDVVKKTCDNRNDLAEMPEVYTSPDPRNFSL